VSVHIGELTLRVQGISPEQGRRLAELVGRGLATLAPGSSEAHEVVVTVDARPYEPVERTADRIAASVHGTLGEPA
jgi:hypothetical protein